MSILKKFPHNVNCACHVCNPPKYEDDYMNAKVTPEERVSNQSQKLYNVGGGYVSKEWAKLFLLNWNRAVELWDSGEMFSPEYKNHYRQELKMVDQQEYARICLTWFIPNRFQEPHCVAQGE